MPTMLEVEAAIIAALQNTAAFETVGRWSGQIDDIIAIPKRMPAALVVYQGAGFLPRSVIEAIRTTREEEWGVVIVMAVPRGGGGQTGSVISSLLPATRAALSGLAIGDAELWPVRDGIIDSIAGVMMYEAVFSITIDD